MEEPTDHLTVPGTDVTFVCTSSQNNTTWLHNNTIIEPGPHYNITSNDHGTSILTVRNVTTDDQGEYHCCVSEWKSKVQSRYGHLKSKYLHTITSSYYIQYDLAFIQSFYKNCAIYICKSIRHGYIGDRCHMFD